jgi:type IV pilus assembly protein PilN
VPETTALETMTAEASPVDIDAPSKQPLSPPGTVTFTGVALPRFENVADFVVRMDNLQYLANAELDTAERQGSSQDSPVHFEVASALVTIAGQNGSKVKIEGVSQDKLAVNGNSLNTREVANVRGPNGSPAARSQYASRAEGGRR